ncbi:MAG: GYD domain-containing protein [Vicinamibacterales bacterium]
MPRYLIEASYTLDGARGLVKDGGSKRKATVARLVESAGGRLEAFYFVFGDRDVVAIVDLPDNVSAAAVALIPSASGGATIKTSVLLTPEEIDQAVKKTVTYVPPGQ